MIIIIIIIIGRRGDRSGERIQSNMEESEDKFTESHGSQAD